MAEGIFAAEIVAECRRRGLLAGAYALRRPRGATFLRRLARDLGEQRKAPRVLIRRGLLLLRTEPTVLRRQTGLGAEAARGRVVLRRVAALLAGHPHRAAHPSAPHGEPGHPHPPGQSSSSTA
ncbi:hypothetical protein ACIBTV_18285 [Micromonospora sp. NPDC049366]|uniref:hypothetical protein n=1 Tax=Micromonospora sp. NPDC049366 TaxID=3364271 RepID=UPI0037A92888